LNAPLLSVVCLVQREKSLSLNHRGRLDIMANILHTAANGAKKTQLMYRCNLSFKQLQLYLNLLMTKRLLSKQIHNGAKDVTIYETTAKGQSFLQVYHTMNALLSA
jgi:predicted transcriptional regulator